MDGGGTEPGKPDATTQPDGGKKAEDGAMLPVQKHQPDVVSVGPPYSVADQKYQYQPKGSEPQAPTWKVKEGPSGMVVEDKQVGWTPDKNDKGVHHVVVEGQVKDKNIKQEYELTVAVPEKRAEAKASPKDGGEVRVKSPTSKIEGAEIKARPGSLRATKTLTISELDKAPPMANKDGELKAVQFGPKGQAFARPALIALPLPDDAVLDRSRVGAFVYNPAGRWERVRTIGIDLEHRFVFAEAQHFSVYAAAQGSLDMDVSVESMPAASSCEGTLIGRAEVGSPLADVESSALNKAAPAIKTLIDDGASNMQALLSAPDFTGSVRFVRVLELLSGEGADAVLIEERVAVATLFAPGDGSAILRHTRSSGEVVAELSFDNLADNLTTISKHLRGLATHVKFEGPGADALSVAARLHIVYAEGDASLDPISVDDLGIAATDVAPSEPGTPDVAPNLDTDCDRLRNDYDSTDNRVLPRLAVSPDDVATTFVGASLRLSGHVENLKDAPTPTWKVIAGDGTLSKVDDDEEARDFQADTAGRHQVELSVPGADLSYVFVIDVLDVSGSNHAPTCTPSAGSLTAKLGETIGLNAVAVDQETSSDALTVEWGLIDDSGAAPELLANGQLEGFAQSAVLTPAATGSFRIGCRAFDGVAYGTIGQVEVSVLEADTNRLPEDVFLSPPSSTIEVGGSVAFVAQGSDPDDDTLSFEWETSGGSLGAETKTKTTSERTLTANAQGVIDVTVSVSDGKGPPTRLSATVLVVADLDMLDGADDADGDGFPAGKGPAFDCDDQNGERYPTAVDVCGNAVDEDCSGAARVDDCDDDGFVSPADCQDFDPTIHPDAFELCNGIDDNCVDGIDETFREALGATCSVGVGACLSQGVPTCASDRANVVCVGQPGSATAEICDGIDDDCDGEIDEGLICDPFDGGVFDGGVTDAGPTCIVANEVCNGVDDDCDLAIDEDFVSLQTTCGRGACAATGETSCVDGEIVDSCEAALPESLDNDCNGIDDDCNGTPDDAFPGSSTTCGDGVCTSDGSESCVNGQVSDNCIPGPQGATSDTTCDGIDDDCDGDVDEDFAGLETTCGEGACASGGAFACVDGEVVDSCQASEPTAATDTSCDNVDNDCNGIVDDGYVRIDTNCGTGTCAATGRTSCVNGSVVDSCVAGTPAANDATCNNVDEDCSGAADEDYAAIDTNCGTGACAAEGATSCVNGSVVDSCTAGTPAANDATCNNVDEDCSGTADEDYVAADTNCGTGACAANGATSCVNGSVVDSCAARTPAASDATCNNIDEDCNGTADEDYVVTSTSCGTGACAANGATSCVNGSVVDSCAAGTPAANDATCNSIDDDCNGTNDEDYASVGTSCGIGACSASGSTSCVDGGVQNNCVTGPPLSQTDSTCDGIDDDCNGITDDLPPSSCETAQSGACALGHYECNGASFICVPNRAANPESCNAIDDNCNAGVDEGGTCAVNPVTNSLVGVWFECQGSLCDVLRSHGMMFLNQPAPNAGYSDAFSLNSPGKTAYTTDAPYCGDGRFDWRSDGDGDADPATQILTVRWTEDEGTMPPCIDDFGCVEGKVCRDGGCAATCTLDSDCAAGATCFAGACRIVKTAVGNLLLTAADRATVTWTSLPAGPEMGPVMELLRVPENSSGQCPMGGGQTCACNTQIGICEAGCACDPDCGGGTCQCNVGTSCDKECGCDPDCGGGCSCNTQPGFCEAGCGCDPDCGFQCQPTEICGNTSNDDCDGFNLDESDPDCQVSCAADPTQPACGNPGETCLNAINISAGGMFPSAIGSNNDGVGKCGGPNNLDRVFYFDVGTGGVEVTLGVTSTSGASLAFSILAAPPGWQPDQGCGAGFSNGASCLYGSNQFKNYLPGGRYIVVVEGAPAAAPFTLRLGKRLNGTCNPPLALTGDADGISICDGDCDDNSSSVNPGAADTCNGVDDNCNGYVDDLSGTCSTGLPGVCATGKPSCDAAKPCEAIQTASIEDYCGDNQDNDCDGAIDEAGCVDGQGESCTTALPIGSGGTFSGTLAGKNNDAISGCGFGGAEVFYAFTVSNGSTELVFNANTGTGKAARYALYAGCDMLPVSCGMPNNLYLQPGNYLLAVEHDGSIEDPSYQFSMAFSSDGVCLTADGDADGQTICQGDCNDQNGSINRGASEGSVCDMIDNDCNGQIDDLGMACSVPDAMGVCAQGSVKCSAGTPSCVPVNQADSLGRDLCLDGLDNDCDGASDTADLQGCVAVPAGDICSLAEDVSSGGIFNHSLNGYGNDVDAGCSDGPGIGGGLERFYSLTLTETRRVVLQASTQADGYISIAMHDTCATLDVPGLCTGGYFDHVLDPGTYYFAVISKLGVDYRLTVSTQLPNDPQGTSCVPGDVDIDGFTLCNGDCAEGVAAVYPGAQEVCNGVDDNCNGSTDEGTPNPACSTQGVGECAFGHVQCSAGSNTCVADRVPGQDPDVCGDGKDNNCDGAVDEATCSQPNAESCVLAVDLANGNPYITGSMVGATDDITACGAPGSPDRFYRFSVASPVQAYLNIVPLTQGPAPSFAVSVYRGDCSGNAQGLGCYGAGLNMLQLFEAGTYFLIVESNEAFSYEVQLGISNGATCSTPDSDGDGYTLCANDCNDTSPTASPALLESCDGVDNNCDGAVDNIPANTCETGLLGICTGGTTVCSGPSVQCQPLNVARANDICGDGLDNDCDGMTDEPGCESLPAGETCGLAVDVTGGGVYPGSLVGAINDESSVCSSTGAPDRFYKFTLAQDTYVHVDVKAAGAVGPVQFQTSLFSGSCASRGGLSCSYPALNGVFLSAGTYFFVVEGNVATDYNVFVALSNGAGCMAGAGNGDFDGDGTTLCNNDCDESKFSVHPGASEVCNNGSDDDCDGAVDNVRGTACASGQPGDCNAGTMQCPPVGADPVCVPIVQPGSRPELCGDGIDNDCDGPNDDQSDCVTATGNSCNFAIDVTNVLNGKVLGTITDPNDDTPGCGRTSAEIVYRLTPAASGTLFMNIVATSGSERFEVRSAEASCAGSFQCQQELGARSVIAGQPLFITVEGPLGVPFQLTFANRPDESPQGACFDGVTNQGFGDVDADGVALCNADCNEANPAVNPNAVEICGDSVDDNCDGALNYENFPCNTGLFGLCAEGRTHCIVSNQPANCDAVDTPQAESCNNQDDDCDGLTDEDNVCGAGCIPQPEICNNAIDDDCDTFIDGSDSDCLPPPPPGETCPNAVPITPGSYSTSLAGYTNDIASSCFAGSQKDRFYKISIPSGSIGVTIAGAPPGTGWTLYSGACGALNQMFCGPSGQSPPQPPGDYFIVLEGEPPAGEFGFTVTVGP